MVVQGILACCGTQILDSVFDMQPISMQNIISTLILMCMLEWQIKRTPTSPQQIITYAEYSILFDDFSEVADSYRWKKKKKKKRQLPKVYLRNGYN